MSPLIKPPAAAAYIAYVRDSGGDDQDLSVPRQIESIRAWCQDHQIVLLKVYADEARPGSNVVGREAFQQMMAYFRSPECQAQGLVIWKFSRFARDIDDSQYYKADLRRRGFIVHSMTDAIPEGSTGRFLEGAIDWMNQRFLEDLSADVKAGLKYVVGSHGAVPGNPPRGFLRQPVVISSRRTGQEHTVSRWVPDPALSPLIKRAFDMRAAGASYAAIHRETGLYNARSSWTHFFANKIYMGTLVYGELTIPDYCEPIVDLHTWYKVQEVNSMSVGKRNLTSERHPRRASSSYLLSGIVYCAQCGSAMSGEAIYSKARDHTNRYYTCNNRKRTGNCTARNIPKDALEQAVIKDVYTYILNTMHLTDLQDALREGSKAAQSKLATTIETNSTALAQVQRQISNMINAIASGGHSTAMLQKLSELELSRDRLKAMIAEAEYLQQLRPPEESPDELQVSIQAIKQAFESAALARKREILRSFLSRIVVERMENKITGMIEYYYPIPPADDRYAYELSHQRASSYTLDRIFHLSILINLY